MRAALARAGARLLGLLCCAALASVSMLAVAATDVGRVVAIGDLHGDYDAYRELLSQAGLIDAKGHWSGGHSVFVQLGDAVDRGPDSRDIILDLQRLQREAARAGGQVIALVGNHEAMNVTGDLRYVPPEEFQNYVTRKSASLREATFEANLERIEAGYRRDDPQFTEAQARARFEAQYPLGYFEQRLAWAPGGPIGRWVLANPAVAIVGDSLFVHGGISAAYAARGVGQINDAVHDALHAPPADGHSIIDDQAGPLWYRGLAEESDASRQDVAAALQAYGVRRIVIGHTPSLSGIRALFGGRVIMTDTGITRSYGGTHSFLVIDGARIEAHDGGRVTELPAGGEHAGTGAEQ
jgi:hypothetical protein